ncbi:hypothetical protein BGX34_000958, partial [Mortierella sp. NVP85]
MLSWTIKLDAKYSDNGKAMSPWGSFCGIWSRPEPGRGERAGLSKRPDPFLRTYTTDLPGSIHYWDHELDPSAEGRGIARDSGGARPDFQSYFADGSTKSCLLAIEVTKKQQWHSNRRIAYAG